MTKFPWFWEPPWEPGRRLAPRQRVRPVLRCSVPQNAPQFMWNPVNAIHIDRWSTPRVVYIAHLASSRYDQAA